MSDNNFAMQIKVCVAAVLGALTALWGWFGWLFGSAAAAKEITGRTM